MGKTGIIFVHGIVGNNRIFDFLRTLVPEKCEVRYVDLKGHGGDALAFSRASMKQWRDQVEEAVGEMRARCGRILGIGHSMGCLLLLEMAAKDMLSELFLLNPPMSFRLRLSLVGNALKVATGHLKGDSVAQAAKEAYGVSIDLNPLHYYGWPRRYVELFTEIAHVRKSVLANVRCPVTAFFSRDDEMVSPASAKIIARLPDVSTFILPKSTHYYYPLEDREIICREFNNTVISSLPSLP